MFLYGIVFLYGALRNSFYYMGFIDICLLTVLFIGAFKGWCSGFFREIISMSGFVIGLLFAGSLYAVVGDYLAPRLGSSVTGAHVMAFVFIWFVVPMVLGFVANFMSRTMKKLHLGGLNSMLGAAVGIFKYLLLLSAVVNVLDFCTRFVKLYSDETKQESYLYYPVKSFISVIVPDNITSSENDAEPADENNQQTVEKE